MNETNSHRRGVGRYLTPWIFDPDCNHYCYEEKWWQRSFDSFVLFITKQLECTAISHSMKLMEIQETCNTITKTTTFGVWIFLTSNEIRKYALPDETHYAGSVGLQCYHTTKWCIFLFHFQCTVLNCFWRRLLWKQKEVGRIYKISKPLRDGVLVHCTTLLTTDKSKRRI